MPRSRATARRLSAAAPSVARCSRATRRMSASTASRFRARLPSGAAGVSAAGAGADASAGAMSNGSMDRACHISRENVSSALAFVADCCHHRNVSGAHATISKEQTMTHHLVLGAGGVDRSTTATLVAAEESGAGLVIIGNLYGYGEVEAPMHEDDPLRPSGHKGRIRADMWTEALARHEAGRLRVTELRSSDYFGPGTTPRTSYLNDIVIDALLAGRPPFVPVGRADAPHSWTYVPDVGRLAARVATGGDGWGRAWHVPTSPARTFDEAAGDIARLAGVKP